MVESEVSEPKIAQLEVMESPITEGTEPATPQPVVITIPDVTKAIIAALNFRDARLNVGKTTTFDDLFLMLGREIQRLGVSDIKIYLSDTVLADGLMTETWLKTIVAPEGANYSNMRLRSMLARLLAPHDLTYVIQDGSLLITTAEDARRRASTLIRNYPIEEIDIEQSADSRQQTTEETTGIPATATEQTTVPMPAMVSDVDERTKAMAIMAALRHDVSLTLDKTTTLGDLFVMVGEEMQRLGVPNIEIYLDSTALDGIDIETWTKTVVAPEGFEFPADPELGNVLITLLDWHGLVCSIQDGTIVVVKRTDASP
jgi:hypothetical protein